MQGTFCHCEERSDEAIYFSVLLKIVIASLNATGVQAWQSIFSIF
jgi:hypothetical protein